MGIVGIAHVAIYTNEFEKTIDFYKNVLEAKEIGHPNTPRRGAFLSVGKDVFEFFESEKMEDGVIKHIALECDDADAMYEKAISYGAISHMEPKDIVLTLANEANELVDNEARVAFVKGFAGEQIEFMQIKKKLNKFIFLGSSVTYGEAAGGVSFVDFLAERNNVDIVKEAVSGTTLVDEGEDSYVSRLKTISVPNASLFVCQLSTNDASQKKEIGEVSKSFDISSFDTKTIAGAIEYIISYAKEKWNCPVAFYTNPKYDSSEYQQMVDILYKIKDKWDIAVIDLWSDEKFNDITSEKRTLYMADVIHPTKEGYKEWLTPYIEQKISGIIRL